MNILLIQSTVYLPSWGGANKSNRLLLEGMARRGHTCQALAPACGAHACGTVEQLNMILAERNISKRKVGSYSIALSVNGVDVTAVTDTRHMVRTLRTMISEVTPDLIVVASEDPGQALLAAALGANRGPVIYLARTTMALPFGPASPIRSETKTRLLKQAAGIVMVSQYLKTYLQEWARVDSVQLPICPNGPGPFPDFANFDSGFVTMVNPCAYKGITIFAAMAKALPDVAFAAVPTWGTNEADLLLLQGIPNVTILPPRDDVDEIFSQTRVLLVPSLWAEAKANMITEAMLRGIPVLTSDVGGNSEAMLGSDYLLPVNAIDEFTDGLDSRLLPIAAIPRQNVEPWINALWELLSQRELYERVSTRSRSVALAANSRDCDGQGFEQYLKGVREPGSSCGTEALESAI